MGLAASGGDGGKFSRRSGGLWRRHRLPVLRQQFRQPVHGMSGDTGQHVAQVGERIQLMPLAGGDEAEEDGGRVSAIIRAGEQPILAFILSCA